MNKLKNLREKKGITRKEMAAILDISESAVSNYELGLRVPMDKIKKKYADYFNLTVDDIFFDKNNTNRAE